ncbi:MAG: Unknown protein [uncultured Sulfurovum sp.]|uniref:Uncharacterized protein n=1 Tax=uncultured Sulfurovum sp. TaxID=269237 RepID=A0A6S6SY96_9BACT|nr:MAG: Unknown protein [uncultured Sulfurovum sp.]
MENFYLVIIAVLGLVVYFFRSKHFTQMKGAAIKSKFTAYDDLMHGYLTLIKLLYHDDHKNDLNQIVKKIITKRADGRYVSLDSEGNYQFNTLSFSLDSFYDLIKTTQKKEINLMLELDDKLTLQDLNGFLQNCLGNKISNNSFLQTHLKENTFIYKKILLAYQKELNKEFIQLSILHDGFGSYYVLVFHLNQEKVIEKSVKEIGLKYEKLSLENNFNLKDNNEENFVPTTISNANLKLSGEKT